MGSFPRCAFAGLRVFFEAPDSEGVGAELGLSGVHSMLVAGARSMHKLTGAPNCKHIIAYNFDTIGLLAELVLRRVNHFES